MLNVEKKYIGDLKQYKENYDYSQEFLVLEDDVCCKNFFNVIDKY